MDLSVLTVTWNSAEHIGDQIKSVRSGSNSISYEQLIADNASTDKTAIITNEDHPEVRLCLFQKNLGFGAANNELAKLARGEFILLLNPDMKVSPGALDMIVEWARKNPKAGIVSCKLLDQEGKFDKTTSPRRFPAIWDQIAIMLKLHHFFPRVLNKYLLVDFDCGKEQKVDSVQGSFLLLRRDVYEKMGRIFDPRFFIWFEDVDLCREVWKLGFEVWYTPVVSCVDYKGKSFAQKPLLWKQKQFTKSMLQYFRKWEKWYVWIWIALFRPVTIFLAAIHDYFLGL